MKKKKKDKDCESRAPQKVQLGWGKKGNGAAGGTDKGITFAVPGREEGRGGAAQTWVGCEQVEETFLGRST